MKGEHDEMNAQQLKMALKYAPHIYADKAEPFPIRLIGCSVFTEKGYSQSFPGLELDPRQFGATAILEYAIYYDYDIQHLYDLEHIWVAVGREGQVADCWCSFHGMRLRAAGVSMFRVEDTHPVLYAQPGKHAMLPAPELFELHPQFHTACNTDAGGGLLVPPMLRGRMFTDEARDERVKRYIRSHFVFEPTLEFEQEDLSASQFVTLPELLESIPKLVEEQLRIIE